MAPIPIPYNLSVEEFDKIWNEKILPNLINKDNCILCHLKIFTYNDVDFRVRKFVYEKYCKNNNIEVDYAGKSLFSTCNNIYCVNVEHIKNEWNSEEVFKKILANSERLEPIEGQEIGCLVWRKSTDINGYGVICYGYKNYQVHVAAMYVKTNNPQHPVDENGRKFIVRHKCKNRSCCEHTHLEYGTHLENNLDMIRDGTICRGEKSACAKISEELAQEIKNSIALGLTPTQRANKFGVSVPIIRAIDTGSSWNYLPGPNDEVVNKLVAERKEREVKMVQELKERGLNDEDYAILFERLKKKLEIKDCGYETPCDEWGGVVSKDGYPKVKYNYRTFSGSIVACEIYHGKKPTQDSIVIHKCQNKVCLKKEHIFWGTIKDRKRKEK